MNYLDIQGHQVRVSNLDKILWPDVGVTKGDMIKYYIKVADKLLAVLSGRLVSMQRFPDGIKGEGFYQKNCPQGAPPWVKTQRLERGGGKSTNYILVDSLATLVWLANSGVIEFHPWLSPAHSLDTPDWAVFDLDPMEKYGLREVCQVVLFFGEMLEHMGLRGQPKYSGATGMQIFVPIEPIYSYPQIRDFVGLCCRFAEQKFKDWTTTERAVANRQGKIYLDYMQNAREKTIVAAYSLRPVSGARYSAPLTWAEVEDLRPEKYCLENALQGAEPGPWLKEIKPQRLEAALERLKTWA